MSLAISAESTPPTPVSSLVTIVGSISAVSAASTPGPTEAPSDTHACWSNIARTCRCRLRARPMIWAMVWPSKSGRLSRTALASIFWRSTSGTLGVVMNQPICLASFSAWRGESCQSAGS